MTTNEILNSVQTLVGTINNDGYIENWWVYNEDPSVIQFNKPSEDEFFWNGDYHGWTYYKIIDNQAVFDDIFIPLEDNMRITTLDDNNKAVNQIWKPFYKEEELICPAISDYGLYIWNNDLYVWSVDDNEGLNRHLTILRNKRNILFAAFDILKINLRITNGLIYPDLEWNPELSAITQERWDTEFKNWYLGCRDLNQTYLSNPPIEVSYYA